MTAGQLRAGESPIVFPPAPAVGWMSWLTPAAFGQGGLLLAEGEAQLSVGGARLSYAALLPLCLAPSPPRSAPLRRYAAQYPRPHAVAHATARHAALCPVVSRRCQL